MLRVIPLGRPLLPGRRCLVIRAGLLHQFRAVYDELLESAPDLQLTLVTTRGFLAELHHEFPRIEEALYHRRGRSLVRLLRRLSLAEYDRVVVTSGSMGVNALCLWALRSGYYVVTPEKSWYWVGLWGRDAVPAELAPCRQARHYPLLAGVKRLAWRVFAGVQLGRMVMTGCWLWLRSCVRLKMGRGRRS